MQKREKILFALVVSLLGMMGLQYGYNAIDEQFTRRQARIDSLQQDISRKELQVHKGQRAGRALAEYEARSLPADRELARSLYQNWLMTLVEKSGLSGGVTSQAPQSQRANFDRLSFAVSGQGTLSEVVQLLHDFYSANHLQQVRMLSLKPIEEGKKFELLLGIEALALPGAKHADQLPAEPSTRLALADFAAYQKPITTRNIFAPYTPPPPKPAPKPEPPRVVEKPAPTPPPFDVAKHTTVSAIISDNGEPQVWLNNRTTGNVLRLNEGGQFEVGTLRGTIGRIGLREIELLVDGQRLLVGLGENLRDGSPMSADGI